MIYDSARLKKTTEKKVKFANQGKKEIKFAISSRTVTEEL